VTDECSAINIYIYIYICVCVCVCVTAGDDMIYNNWYIGGVDNTQWEPNTRSNECMIMDLSRGFTWSDSDCSQVHPFYCQKGKLFHNDL